MRKAAAGALALGLTLAGCADNHDDDYVAVCTDKQGNRVDDDHCKSGGDNDFIWYYLLWNATRPPIGSNIHNYNYGSAVPRGYQPVRQKPANAKKVQTGVPLKGFTPPAAKPPAPKPVQQAPKVNSPKIGSGGGYNKAPNPAPRFNPPPAPRAR